MRVLIWVQHLRGVGHLRRMTLIARALGGRGAAVTLISGGPPVPAFETGPFQVLHLPALQARDSRFAELVDAEGGCITDSLMRRRADILMRGLDRIAPDVIVTELFPFGRRKFRGELLPFLERARSCRPRPLILSSVRDILEPASDPARLRLGLEWAHGYFDALLVHADPKFLKLNLSAPWIANLHLPCYYTGYVAAAAPADKVGRDDSTDIPEILVTAGGGRGGASLVHLAAKTAELMGDGIRLRWRLVGGPAANWTVGEQSMADYSGSEIIRERNRDDIPCLMQHAAMSISRAGYNTVGEALAARARMILIPEPSGGQNEQRLRAIHLEERGLAVHLAEPGLRPETLASVVAAQLHAPRPCHRIDLDGDTEAARRIEELWRAHRAQQQVASTGKAG